MRTSNFSTLLISAVVTIVVATSCGGSGATEVEPSVEVKVIDEAQTQQDPETEYPNPITANSAKRLDGEAPEGDTRPAVFGERNEGEIEEAFAADLWIFEASAGQELTLEINDEGSCFLDTRVVLRTPSGEGWEILPFLNRACRTHGPIELEESGEYVIEFVGGSDLFFAETGRYVFTPRFLTDTDRNSVVFDELNEGEIEEPLAADFWTFEASAGQELTVEINDEGSCFLGTRVTVLKPSGETFKILDFFNNDCKTHGPYELDESGDYVLEFVGTNDGFYKETGAYVFTPRIK